MKKTLLGGALALAASAAMWPVLSNGLGTRPIADDALTARGRAVTIDVLANDGLTGLQALRVLYPPAHGTAQVVGDRIVYTPAPGFTGRDRFFYTAKAGRSFGKAAVDVDVGEALVLRGKVTDGPIAQAQVSASLGGRVFRTQADANGDYALEVIGLGNGMLTMAAQGTGAQAPVNFRSVVGGFARLRGQAGADGVLERGENNQVQVTNVSTAQAVLMQAANGGAPIADEAALQVARESLDQPRLLQSSSWWSTAVTRCRQAWRTRWRSSATTRRTRASSPP